MKCATDGCDRLSTGKSKYCPTHKAEARKAWLARIEADKQSRADRASEFEDLWRLADTAGQVAATGVVPAPMLVYTPTHVFGDTPDLSKPVHVINDGVCGYASIIIRPGNHPFANWCKTHVPGWKSYYGGWELPVRRYGQSYERKMAYATAFAQVVADAGINARASGRLD